MKTYLLFHHKAGQTVILIVVGERREVFLGLLFNVKGCHYVIDLNGSKERLDELTSRLNPSSLKCWMISILINIQYQTVFPGCKKK